MELNILDKIPLENFTIENKIVKGVRQDEPESYQIGKLLFDIFDSKPDHVAQIQAETDERTTFAEIKENSVRCALWLKNQGIGRGYIVVIYCDNRLDAYIPVLASFFLGATHNAWNDRVTSQQAQHLIRILRPKIIIATAKVADVIVEAGKMEDFHGKIVAFDSYPGLKSLHVLMQQQTLEEVKSFQPQTLINPEDIAYIILTSGSTGFPKGVTHSYGNIVKQIATGMSYSMKGIILIYANWAWISGFIMIMQSFLNYGTIVFHGQFDPEETSKVIEKYKVESVCLTPTALWMYCKSDVLKRYQLSSLKLVLVGGSKIHSNLIEQFRKMLPHVTAVIVMGSSETARMILSQTEKCKTIDSVGYVMSNIEVKICDLETNEILGPNMPGEFCVKSNLATKGYYKDEAATRAAFDSEGWFHTGDVAYYDENGEFFLIDRIKEMMKYQNYHVSPNEIEQVLLSHPGVMEVAVVPIPHERDGDHPVAFVKKKPGLEITEEELVKLSESLGEIKKLHGGVKFIDEIPKLGSGKVDRRTLKERAKMLNQN